MKRLLIISILFSSYVFAADLPDSNTTPGVINPNVTQENIKQTICISGWTKTIRPTTNYTNKLKLAQMNTAGLTGKPSEYEEDHLISLELGGHPTDPKNLWPQLWAGTWGAHKKDAIETRLKTLVCKGKISLADAQKDISTNWIDAYNKYFVKK